MSPESLATGLGRGIATRQPAAITEIGRRCRVSAPFVAKLPARPAWPELLARTQTARSV